MLENGKVKLTVETAKKISSILGISSEKIFEDDVQET
jgi:DNA-binding XRE family transcriptional regulator